MTDIVTPPGCYAFLDGGKFEANEKIGWSNLARNNSDSFGGNISPSSDSGLGSEEEEQSTVYENIQAIQSHSKSLSDLTQALTINCDTGITVYKWRGADEYTDDQDGGDLSLLLTTQNPARIDVKTLKKNKVKSHQWPLPVSYY